MIHDWFANILSISIGSDFVLTASDSVFARSIVLMKIGEDKSRALNNNTLLLYSGESGDTGQFAEYIQKNIQLYSIRHAHDLSPTAVAHFTRREMADSLRTRVSTLCYIHSYLARLSIERLPCQCLDCRHRSKICQALHSLDWPSLVHGRAEFCRPRLCFLLLHVNYGQVLEGGYVSRRSQGVDEKVHGAVEGTYVLSVNMSCRAMNIPILSYISELWLTGIRSVSLQTFLNSPLNS